MKEKYKNVSVEGVLNPKTVLQFQKMCPICGYPLQLKFNKNYGLKLYMCTNEPELCEYMTNDIHGGKVSICKCDKCKDGFLIVKQSKQNNYFLGCSNYKSINCTRQMSFQEYFLTHNIQSTEPIKIDYNKNIVEEKTELYQELKEEAKNSSDERKAIGAKWTPEEEKQLLEEFSNGMKIAEIAKIHSRNVGGIRARLKKLGVIEE